MQQMQRTVPNQKQWFLIKWSTQKVNRESTVFEWRRNKPQTRIGSVNSKILWSLWLFRSKYKDETTNNKTIGKKPEFDKMTQSEISTKESETELNSFFF